MQGVLVDHNHPLLVLCYQVAIVDLHTQVAGCGVGGVLHVPTYPEYCVARCSVPWAARPLDQSSAPGGNRSSAAVGVGAAAGGEGSLLLAKPRSGKGRKGGGLEFKFSPGASWGVTCSIRSE